MAEECPKCGVSTEREWAVCPGCATSLRSTDCESCGKKMQSGWKACPFCGWMPDASDVPELPDDDELERAKGPSPAQKERAQKLLDQFVAAIAEYARESQKGPSFGEAIGFLFGKKSEGSPSLERALELRDKVYETLDDSETCYAGPWWEILTDKAKKKAMLDRENGMVDVLRRETQYMAGELGLTLDGGSRRQDFVNMFICPGCCERSTAKNGSLCPNCNQYVHHDCALKGLVRWSCPLCKTGLVGQT